MKKKNVTRETLPRFSYDQLTTEKEIEEIAGLDGPVAVSIKVTEYMKVGTCNELIAFKVTIMPSHHTNF